MKALLSIFLGVMLFTSFLGISYATPVVNLQPMPASANNGSCSYQAPNTMNMNATCQYDHTQHDHNPHGSNCAAPPSGPEVSDVQADSVRNC